MMRVRARGLKSWLGLAAMACALLPLQAQTGGAGLIKAGETPGLFLLYSGDVIGYVDPCG